MGGRGADIPLGSTPLKRKNMKIKFIATLVFIIPTLGFGQINQSIDFISGIEYSYRKLTTSSEDEFIVGILDKRDNKESGKLNWRIGFNYNLRLTNKIFLKTGLRLASVGYKGEKRTGLKWGSEHDGKGGWIPDPSLPHEIQMVHDYWFTTIPIAGRFEINQKKLSSFFELGVSPSIYMTTRTKIITDIGTDSDFQNGDVHNFNKLHIVGFVSFGMNYSLNDNFQFFGQPIVRYHLTKMADAPIGEYLYNFGMEIGVRRKIK